MIKHVCIYTYIYTYMTHSINPLFVLISGWQTLKLLALFGKPESTGSFPEWLLEVHFLDLPFYASKKSCKFSELLPEVKGNKDKLHASGNPSLWTDVLSGMIQTAISRTKTSEHL